MWSYLDDAKPPKMHGPFESEQMAHWYRQRYLKETLLLQRSGERGFITLRELVHKHGGRCPFKSSSMSPLSAEAAASTSSSGRERGAPSSSSTSNRRHVRAPSNVLPRWEGTHGAASPPVFPSRAQSAGSSSSFDSLASEDMGIGLGPTAASAAAAARDFEVEKQERNRRCRALKQQIAQEQLHLALCELDIKALELFRSNTDEDNMALSRLAQDIEVPRGQLGESTLVHMLAQRLADHVCLRSDIGALRARSASELSSS